MSEEFINYLKYIGFLNEKTIPFFVSLYNSVQEPDAKSSKEKMKMKIISSLVQYTKSLTENQIIEIMTNLYERYIENKIKIESNKLLNLIKIYKNKSIQFYFIYWCKLSQYLKHKEIQKYQQQLMAIKNNENKSINNSNFINGDYLDAQTVNDNFNNKNNFIPNNISMIKVRNSNNTYNNTKSKTPSKEFIERQEKYMQLKKKNLMKNIDNNEEEFQLLYTFKPCLVESTKSYCYGGNNPNFRNKNLYNNKIHEMKMKNLRETVDNERGLTFKPKINKYTNNYNKKKNFEYFY
jgi:hypothetical protein